MRRPLVAASGLVAALALAGAAQSTSTAGPYRNGQIAFVRCCDPTEVAAVRPNGSGERTVFRAAASDAPLTPAWSPSGRELAFVPGAPRRGLWVVRGDGSGLRRVTPGRGDPLFPSWAPGGGRLVFADLGNAATGFHDLYVVGANGKGLLRLTRARADETHPAWAPSRPEIVYERAGDVWRMSPDGSAQRRLLRNAVSPAWSPAGSHLAFVRGGDPWIARRDGSGAKRVVDLPKEHNGLAWSPDGRWLVLAPVDRGELLLVSADGSQTRPLTTSPGRATAWPSWQRLAR